MLKLVTFSTLLAVAVAAPTILHSDIVGSPLTAIAAAPITTIAAAPVTTISASPILTGIKTVLAPETIQIHEPAIAKVGDLVQKIPTAVSHQSQTVVHNHADVHTPIVAPAVRTYTSHILKAYSSPLVYASAAPVLKVLRD